MSHKKGHWELIELTSRGDDRGELVAIQGSVEIPFDIKRVYYLTKTLEGVVRGHHAHKDLDQVLISVSGSCVIHLDDGHSKQEFILSRHTQGLRISNLVWREMHRFSPDCVLLVLANKRYDPSDYIRDYQEFKTLTSGFHKNV